MPNRLVNEKSPYLLQHAHNPVDWWPWCDEAFEQARRRDVPVFLSSGYSACHWCHVMERECFEDEDIARLLNENFVSIKLDREERPDVDGLYMDACVAMTGRGGWPLSVFLDEQRRPFYTGSYFPKRARYGQPGFVQVLETMKSLWREDRDRLREAARIVQDHLGKAGQPGELQEGLCDSAYGILEQGFDHRYGGFGGAPKFPSVHNLLFLLRFGLHRKGSRALEMVEQTLGCMAAGGIFDAIGGGFCRYSTDGRWLVPHFEKMLYDNAMLLAAYAQAACAVDRRFEEPARRIVQWCVRDMRLPGGGFATALDADTEGEEGATYLWTPAQVQQALGKQADRFCELFNITEGGNFEGRSIPNHIGRELSEEERAFAQACMPQMLKQRQRRAQPLRDDKVLASSNALLAMALAQAGRLLGEGRWIVMAAQTAEFILQKMVSQGRLLASFRDGVAAHPATSDNYAYLVWALLELHQATLQPSWLQQAMLWADRMLALFWDDAAGGMYLAGSDVAGLFLRPRSDRDGALPCGNSVAAVCLMMLARLTGQERYEQRCADIMRSAAQTLNHQPVELAMMLCALLHQENGGTELVLVQGCGMQAMLRAAWGFHPFTMLAARGADYAGAEAMSPYLEAMDAKNGDATAYLCSKGACQQPITEAAELARRMGGVNDIHLTTAEQPMESPPL